MQGYLLRKLLRRRLQANNRQAQRIDESTLHLLFNIWRRNAHRYECSRNFIKWCSKDTGSSRKILLNQIILKRLSWLDAEVVNSFSSLYKGTAESEVAAKKPHKNEENRQFLLAIFNFMRNLHLKSSAFFIFLFRWLLFCAK